MRIVTGSEMKQLDAWAIKEQDMPGLLLMENAGNAIVQKAKKILGSCKERQIIILAGKGNNGGDALVAARHLVHMGADIKLLLFSPPEVFQGDALRNWEMVEKLGINWRLLQDDNSFYYLKLSLNYCELIIDGIFGTGFSGNPTEVIARAIQIVNESGCPILSIDVPSGVDADTGKIGEPCIKASYTVTFALTKRGLVLYPGRSYTGELEVADISLPLMGLDSLETQQYYVTDEMAREFVPARNSEGFKNSFGHVLVLAGSAGMMGAAVFASKAALRTGAGLVTACLPRSLAGYFSTALPEVIMREVDETPGGTIAAAAWSRIMDCLDYKDAIIFGPGVGTDNETREILKHLLANVQAPLVIDADGLNILAEDISLAADSQVPLILTPHPGELGRLLGVSAQEVQDNRVEAALQTAQLTGSIVVLKGAATVTATPEGQIFINSTGCPVLATAGTGDCLAGIIGSLLAQGVEPGGAALLGVYIHGLAGDIIAREKGMRGSLASDIIEALPLAFKTLEE